MLFYVPMSGTVEVPEANNSKISTHEVLLQVKALQEIRKSLRKTTFNMKTPLTAAKDVEGLKKECQDDDKKETWFRKRDTRKHYFTNFMSELLGTALLMFLGCMGCAPQADNPPASHYLPSLSFGLVVLLIIQIFGHISGAHLNPAVTLSTVIFKMLSPAMGAVYIMAQFLGATFGFALLKVLMPQEWVVPGFCATKPHAKSTAMQSLAIETIITCVLILVCCGVWDKRNAHKQDSTPARFGFIIAAIAMVAGPITGASMNTARSFAPAVLEGDYSNQWIYWLGPTVGAIIGCGLYSVLFAYEEEKVEAIETELEEVSHMVTEKP
ncbi:aquaporin AQPAe.a isoform X2 [Dendroctonus ponderosae]|uniref:Aquaporin n=1 Tax=Dendroctonus ponderosae TaxID=77166 RepID=A0AAR5PT20_DENPD|nr:aquaporin AQPAe.a isoform X2 [Dendroctonus ponderosae]